MDTSGKKTNQIIKRARLRRRREHYRNMLRFGAAMLIVITIATFSLSISSFANDRDADKPVYKYYTSYTVQEGESLSGIADRFISDEYASMDKYLAEVVSINHLISSARIDAGQTLILPYFSSEVK